MWQLDDLNPDVPEHVVRKVATLLNRSMAIYSPCERYRYLLARQWSPGGVAMVWVMLNPSTATEEADDPTVQRCMVRAAATPGVGGCVILNLFAFRATDPSDMIAAEDPIGPDNDRVIRYALTALSEAKRLGPVVAAWGALGDLNRRDRAVLKLVPDVKWQCLGTTNAGNPRHPLYIGYKRALEPWVPVCGKVVDGKRCDIPATWTCPDCGPAAIDFPEGS